MGALLLLLPSFFLERFLEESEASAAAFSAIWFWRSFKSPAMNCEYSEALLRRKSSWFFLSGGAALGSAETAEPRRTGAVMTQGVVELAEAAAWEASSWEEGGRGGGGKEERRGEEEKKRRE